jgi:GMP synthase (glutamine-hydrolysing)
VQGDERSYHPVLMLEGAVSGLHDRATELVNCVAGVTRAVALIASRAPVASLGVQGSSLSAERLARLRHADYAVRRLSREHGFDRQVWQFPVILIPVGTAGRPDSVVLRPVDSVDGMTARSVPMDPALLDLMTKELLQLEGVCAVFYDLTHKPPGTIEWE